MKKLIVGFTNFYSDFNINDNMFLLLLSKNFDVVINHNNPDILFTPMPDQIGYNNSKKILFTTEPILEKGNCDVGLMQYNIDKPDYYRFPSYLYYIFDFIKRGQLDGFDFFFRERKFDINTIKNQKYCNFVCGGRFEGDQQYRDFFVKKFRNYKNIDCPGTRYNNMERLPGDSSNGLNASENKRQFIKNYKFTIGFENTGDKNGYIGNTTEKLIEPMVSNSLLIYWGNSKISDEFNNKSFLNFHDFENEDDFISKIIEIDNDDRLYVDYMVQPLTYNNQYLNIDYLTEYLKKIIE